MFAAFSRLTSLLALSDRPPARRTTPERITPDHGGRLGDFALPQYRDVDPLGTGFFDAGPPDAPAVLFLHGLGGNLTHWQFVAPALAGRFRVLGVDMPGFGVTEMPRGRTLSYRDLVQSLLAFLDRRGVERCLIAGHSFGGAIGTEMALAEPARVRGLVLVSPAGYNRFPRFVKVGSHVALNPMVLGTLAAISAPFVPSQVCRRDTPEVEAFRRSVYKADAALPVLLKMTSATKALRRDLVERHFLDELGRLDLPVHAVWGGADRLLNAEAGARAAAGFRQGRLTWLPDVGHMAIFEAPSRVRDAVVDVHRRAAASEVVTSTETATPVGLATDALPAPAAPEAARPTPAPASAADLLR